MSIQALCKQISDHAATGPSDTPGQAARNSLSPHFERMVGELIRAYLIKHVHETISNIDQEFQSLLGISPEIMAGQVRLTQSRVNAMLHHICK